MTGETIFTVSLSSLTFDKLSTWSVFEGGNLHTNFLLQLGLQKKAITVAFEIGLYPDVPCKLCPLGGELHFFETVQNSHSQIRSFRSVFFSLEVSQWE